MRLRAAAALLLMSLAACGGGDSTGPTSDELKGFWVYQHLASGGGTTCTETGSIQFVPAAARVTGTFDGRGGCESSSLAFDYAKAGVVGGQVAGESVEFTLTASLESCLYQGKLESGAPDQVSGSMVCTPSDGGVPRQGTWSMRR